MKEQTQITADEWLDKEYPYILDGFEYLEIDKQVLDVMEEYANAKVLEALEMYHKEMNMLDDPTVYNVSYDLFKDITKNK